MVVAAKLIKFWSSLFGQIYGSKINTLILHTENIITHEGKYRVIVKKLKNGQNHYSKAFG